MNKYIKSIPVHKLKLWNLIQETKACLTGFLNLKTQWKVVFKK